MRRPRVQLLLAALPQFHRIAASGVVEHHRLVGRVGVVPHALQSRLGVELFPDPARRGGSAVVQFQVHPRHAEFHVDLEPVGAHPRERRAHEAVRGHPRVRVRRLRHSPVEGVGPPPPRRRERVALAGVAIVIRVVPRHLVPRPLHAAEVEVPHRGGRAARLLPPRVGPPLEYRHLDAIVVLDGALEQTVEVGIAVTGEAPGDAGVVPEALGRAGQALPAIRVVLEARPRLRGALVHEAILVDEGRVETLPSVLGVQLVLGVRGREVGGVGQVRQEGVRQEQGREAEGGAERGDAPLELRLLGGIVEARGEHASGVERPAVVVILPPSVVVVVPVVPPLGGGQSRRRRRRRAARECGGAATDAATTGRHEGRARQQQRGGDDQERREPRYRRRRRRRRRRRGRRRCHHRARPLPVSGLVV